MKPILCSLGIHKLSTVHWKHKERIRSNRKGGNHNRYTAGYWLGTVTYCTREGCDYNKTSVKWKNKK